MNLQGQKNDACESRPALSLVCLDSVAFILSYKLDFQFLHHYARFWQIELHNIM